MSSPTDAKGSSGESPEDLWHLVQYKMIQDFNEASDAKKINFKCWPVFSRGEDDRHSNWIVVIVTDEHQIPGAACRIQIDDNEWWEAILVEGHGPCSFSTYQVKVPRNWGNHKQPLFTPLEMTSGANGGTPRPLFTEALRRCARLHLSAKLTPQLTDQIRYKWVPGAASQFQDPTVFRDIYRWGTMQEFEFESEAIRQFNRQSVYRCWLILCHPSNDELQELRESDSRDMQRQQCIVIVAAADPHEAFPKVGDACDLAFDVKIPALDGTIKGTAKDNHSLKRVGADYVKGVRLDNPHEQFSLDGSRWSDYATFKVWLRRKSAQDYTQSLLTTFESQLDPNDLAPDKPKPRITLDEKSKSCFQAHVWLDISDTTVEVELTALEKAMTAPPESRVGEAFSYIRTFQNTGRRNFDIFRAFPHMQNPDGPNSQLPDNLKSSFQGLDEDQRRAYKTVLSDLPCRIGIIPGGPGSGKTQLLLTICALALSNHAPLGAVSPAAHGTTELTGGPVLLILEANRPANAAATRVVEHFDKLGRTDLRILRAYNFNYESKWSTRKYLKIDEEDEESSAFDIDRSFPTHRADHIPPRVRRNDRSDCLAPTLREAAQQYLAEHPEDFPLLYALVNSNPEEINSHKDHENEKRQKEWDALFSAVLARTDFVVTTPVGAAKLSEHFRPRLVIFDDAARARELSTLVSIAHFPSAEAWIFTGTVEMSKPYVGSYGNPKLWNPCAEQLRASMLERSLHVTPDMPRLSLNHQAYGNLHDLSSDLFWAGQIESTLPSSERFPPSTMHLLDYCRSLASNPSLSVPRLLVHVKGPKSMNMQLKSKFNRNHTNWVVQRVIRDLVQDRHFRSTDDKEPGRIIIVTPYKAQFTNYRKEINGLMQELDREHRHMGGRGERLHRQVLVEVRTADTVQGHSADVVVYDLVTSQITSHVVDGNRMCVALTRAKQAEIVVMEASMLGQEGTASGRRELRGTHVDLLYEHCKSNGQVITVDVVGDDHIEKNYTLQRGGANPGRDGSAVPRQLPAPPLPPLTVPQEEAQVETSRAVTESDSQPPKATHDEDDGNAFQSSEDFTFQMVRKAMELGLNLSAETRKGE